MSTARARGEGLVGTGIKGRAPNFHLANFSETETHLCIECLKSLSERGSAFIKRVRRFNQS